ncbi:hypothetical protein EDEG_01447 [Edhazardia aedis USNM 41457]|uniref:Uncharacterized protein n=1 Tax=Edhazardia aedis (strain USNM 41457) TaxID=1003232 RepID=J9D940_EDHAE|nr:hypothetical protein EDEG_01447 [Edhazardia aedis USNM 41457]|eukprot:EJW04291.1 hypothetical protein EDEG_01447 [Edhazardia aedis USNM 41457]
MDLISKEGFRLDGRLKNEHRNIQLEHKILNNMHHIEFIQGETAILATLRTDAYDKINKRKDDRIEFSIVFCDSGLNDRTKHDHIIEELIDILKNTYNNLIISDKVLVEIKIKQNDGGLLASLFNTITVLLCVGGVGMLDLCIGFTVGLYRNRNTKTNTILFDLNRDEERCPSNMVIGFAPHRKTILYITTTKISMDDFRCVYDQAVVGVNVIFQFISDFLKNGKSKKDFLE